LQARAAHHPELAALAAEYPKLVMPLELDVQRLESVEQAKRSLLERVDALDVLVNNAAIRSASVQNELGAIDFDDVKLTLDVIPSGPLRVARVFVPLLGRGVSPTLVNVSSEAGSIEQSRPRARIRLLHVEGGAQHGDQAACELSANVRVFPCTPAGCAPTWAARTPPRSPRNGTRERAMIVREAKNPSGPPFLDHRGAALPW